VIADQLLANDEQNGCDQWPFHGCEAAEAGDRGARERPASGLESDWRDAAVKVVGNRHRRRWSTGPSGVERGQRRASPRAVARLRAAADWLRV
jgi:hypothetical protein